MEIDLMEREFAQLHLRSVPLEERLSTLRGDRLAIDGALSQEESHLEELRNAIGKMEFRLVEAQRDVSVQSEKLGKVQQENLVAAERRKALDDAIVRTENEKAALLEMRV
jgi:chromosome segregation ATPase